MRVRSEALISAVGSRVPLDAFVMDVADDDEDLAACSVGMAIMIMPAPDHKY